MALSFATLLCGVATAYWRAGVDSGLARGGSIANAQPIGFSVAGQSSALLYPGATGDVTVSLTNPYARAISITGLSGVVSTNSPDCAGDNFTVSAHPAGLPASMSASQTLSSVTLTGAVTMKSTAANTCQGVAIDVAYTIAGTL